MKEKIIAAIGRKWPAVNLSKKRREEIAARLESKITDESEIDAKLDEFNEFNPIADIAKNDDHITDLANKLKKKDKPKGADDQPNPPSTEDDLENIDDSTPLGKTLKAMAKQNLELSNSVKALLGERQQSSMKAVLSEKLKEVPVEIWGERRLPEKDEDVEAFVNKVNADWQNLTQEGNNLNLQLVKKPLAGNGGGGNAGGGEGEKPATKEELDAVKITV